MNHVKALGQTLREVASRRDGSRIDAIDPETIALLAAGDLELLSEEERLSIWEAATVDPQVASLVADLSASGVVMRAKPTASRRAPRAALRLALAACGMLAAGLLTWRIVEPPGTTEAPVPIEFMDGASASEHPVDAASSGSRWSALDLARDGVLLALLAATAVLAWPALRDFDRPRSARIR
jgi:hypothetical protein